MTKLAEVMTRPAYEVTFDEAQGVFLKRGERCKGLLPTLKKLYFPQYSHADATLQSRVPKPQPLTVSHAKRPSKHSRRVGRGTFLGTVIHEQIQLSVGYCIKHNLPVEFFINHDTREAYRSEAIAHVYHFCEELMQEDVWRFWGLLAKEQWTPVRSEVPVAHPDCLVATSVDCVVSTAPNAQGDVFLITIEVKTGALHYLYKHTKYRMLTPFPAQTDCVANQHHLQLLHTDEFFRATYPFDPVLDSYVVRLYKGGASATNQRNWAEAQRKVVMKHMSNIFRNK